MLRQLKIQTTKLHLQAEEKNKAKFIIDHSISYEDYCLLLQENNSAYTILENYISKYKHLLPDNLKAFADTRKSNALLHDLQANRCVLVDWDLSSSQMPSAPSCAALVGMLYVIEGSMLGGMYISRHIVKCPQLQHLPPQTFFNGNAKDITRRWKSFSEAVGGLTWSDAEVNEAIAAAKMSFDIFNQVYS
ncbi:MAG: biliverdin-producing heme oxygenase [Leeuwenhoekiella sp.]